MNRFLSIVLHAHVPWVRHPESPRCLEEDWLFEAISESYLPLLDVLHRLRDEEVPYRVTMNFSPVLLEMLQDPMLQDRAQAYLERALTLAQRESMRESAPETHRRLAAWYAARFSSLRDMYVDRWQRDLVRAFRELQETRHLEITATAATHAVLPLLLQVPETVRAQISVGAENYEKTFGTPARGFWLPECAYVHALSGLIRETGADWTIVEAHAFGPERSGAEPNAGCGPRGLAFFRRDLASSRQAWDADTGYPGDPRYREFYRDVGLEAPPEALSDYLEGSPIRRFTGLKMYRITGGEGDKEWYDPGAARAAALEHAKDFVDARADQLRTLAAEVEPGEPPPILVCACDVELFGRWWFEGPQFFEEMLRLLSKRDDIILTTPTEYLLGCGGSAALPSVEPLPSSWSEEGYFASWLSEENTWIYPELHRRATQLLRVVQACEEDGDTHEEPLGSHRRRCVSQMIRELQLAQSGDWPMLMRNETSRDYATRRAKEHLSHFDTLWKAYASASEDSQSTLERIEKQNPIFPDLKPSRHHPDRQPSLLD
ncbi:MAG: 1,4-alpha-glucan branching protein domain-containing protein [Verrucomicrobiales bacterium]